MHLYYFKKLNFCYLLHSNRLHRNNTKNYSGLLFLIPKSVTFLTHYPVFVNIMLITLRPHKSRYYFFGAADHSLHIFKHLLTSLSPDCDRTQSVTICGSIINLLLKSKDSICICFIIFLVPDDKSTKCNEAKRIFSFHSRDKFDFLQVNIKIKEGMTELIIW